MLWTSVHSSSGTLSDLIPECFYHLYCIIIRDLIKVIPECLVVFPTFFNLSLILQYGNGTPLQYSCLENPMDGGAWSAAVHGVAKSRTRLSDFPFTFHFHALEKEMATHSTVLAWRIPGTGEPGGLPSMGSHRVGHNWSDLAAVAALQVILIPKFENCWSNKWLKYSKQGETTSGLVGKYY